VGAAIVSESIDAELVEALPQVTPQLFPLSVDHGKPGLERPDVLQGNEVLLVVTLHHVILEHALQAGHLLGKGFGSGTDDAPLGFLSGASIGRLTGGQGQYGSDRFVTLDCVHHRIFPLTDSGLAICQLCLGALGHLVSRGGHSGRGRGRGAR